MLNLGARDVDLGLDNLGLEERVLTRLLEVDRLALANPCGVRLLSRFPGRRCVFNVSYGCASATQVRVRQDCRATFTCGTGAPPMICGTSKKSYTICECPQAGYCQANRSVVLTNATRVPRTYLEAVYGEDGPVALGSLELLYSSMSVSAAIEVSPQGASALVGAITSSQAHEPNAPETTTTDFVKAAVSGAGQCHLLTGHGDYSCCTATGGVMGSSLSTNTFATTQGQLLYNPYFTKPPRWRAPAATNHSWVEVTRWPNRCVRQLLSGANGRMVSTPCDGFVNNVSYGVWFFGAGGSGVWLNVGRTAVFSSRAHAAHQLCVLGGRVGDFRYHAGGGCKPPHYDDWWCTAARAVGLDSLQIGEEHRYVTHRSHKARRLTEIVYCRHDTPVCGVCPHGLELRSGIYANLPCACNDSIDILNCGRLRPTHCANGGPHYREMADWASSQVPIGGRSGLLVAAGHNRSSSSHGSLITAPRGGV